MRPVYEHRLETAARLAGGRNLSTCLHGRALRAGQVIGLGDEGAAWAPSLVQFTDGDLKLARGKFDRQVGTWLAAARIAGLDLRRSRPAHLEGLTFNAVSPGAVKTSLGSKAGGPFKTIEALTNPFVGPPEKGSRGCVRLMADPELATATGGYYSSAKLKKSSKKSQDAEGQERIYAQTERELRAHP